MARYRDLFGYAGKRVIVTGAASGIGRATVDFLAKLEAEVFALDRSPVEAGNWTYLQTDLGDPDSIDRAAEQIRGPVRGLFNVAGLPGGRGSETITMLVNFFGHRRLTEKLLPKMPRGAAIVNVTSRAGYRYFLMVDELQPMLALRDFAEARSWLNANEDQFNGYGTSKELMNLWTAATCKEYAEKHGVRINAVAPGSTDTPLLAQFRQNAINRTGSEAPVMEGRGFFGRFARPEEQAAACVFMGSDLATMITGQILYVDGGVSGSMMAGITPTPGPRPRD